MTGGTLRVPYEIAKMMTRSKLMERSNAMKL